MLLTIQNDDYNEIVIEISINESNGKNNRFFYSDLLALFKIECVLSKSPLFVVATISCTVSESETKQEFQITYALSLIWRLLVLH